MICKKCNVEKEVSEFSLQKGKYLRSTCKVCEYVKRRAIPSEIVDIDGEEWKLIDGFDGFMISNHARIKSIGIDITRSNGTSMTTRGRILKQGTNTKGYYTVFIKGNNGYKTLRIHRLVATAFIPNPENKPQINHINGIKKDNRIENLEWCTNKENGIHAFATGLNKPRCKLTESQVIDIKTRYPKTTMKELSIEYNVKYGSILSIIRGKNWKHIKV